MSTALVLSTILVIVIITLVLYVKNIYSHWKNRGIPYVKPTFPFGNFAGAFKQTVPLTENVMEIYKISTEPILGAFMAVQPILIVRDPKVIQNIFMSITNRGMERFNTLDPLSNNLLYQSGDKWQENRSKLSPAFTSGKLKSMFDTIVNCGQSMEKYVETFAKSGKTLDIHSVFERFAMNVIASVAFGIDVDCIENPDCDFYRYGKRFFEPLPRNAFRFNISFMYPKLARLLRLRYADEDVGEFMLETVRQNLEYREKNNVVRKDIFQILIQLRNTGKVAQDDSDWSAKLTSNKSQMSIEEMTSQAYLFISSSFESSSTAMSFCLYELAKNPLIQRKLREEINKNLEENDGKLTYESMGEMKYLEKCINETLRLHPPFGTTFRKCAKNYKLSEPDITIEKDTIILIPINALHLDPEHFEEPDKFIPERFDVDSKLKFNEKAYMPFGNGPRMCIAYRLAMTQIKIALILLLHKFQFELDPSHIGKELKIDPRAITKLPIGGINLKVFS